ncbi:hypothetical protein [Plantactinospora sp. KBS50]|uniref:hypothetical protein n=1 Tax=Plantactinospora sp. KBS50 TaxID=2024580 RepID=UPI0012FE1F7D|nr:hypothetical protein [Plantactinospora sp. KBS50]
MTADRPADGHGHVVVMDVAQFSDEKTLADALAADPRGHHLHLADPVGSGPA